MARVAGVAPLFAVLAATLIGCASGPTPGGRLLLSGDLVAAVPRLRSEVSARPRDPVIRRNYAIALQRTGQIAAALAELEIAAKVSPRDERTHLLLGRFAEEAGHRSRALEAYGAYLECTDRDEAAVRRRIRDLGAEETRASVRRALRDERAIAEQPADDTVAVPPFTNVAGQERWEGLSRGLAAVMISDLSQVPGLRIVERARIRVLQEELRLATPPEPLQEPASTVRGVAERLARIRAPGGDRPYYDSASPPESEEDETYRAAVRAFQRDHELAADGRVGPRTRAVLDEASRSLRADTPTWTVDPATAPRLGQLLGAGRFAQGAFTVTGNEAIQLDSFVVSARDSSLTAAGDPVHGRLPEVLRLEKLVVGNLLDGLGVELTPEQRRRITPLATDDHEAFLLFCRGLLLEDRGDLAGAREAYSLALSRDPGFRLAAEHLEILTASPGGTAALAAVVETESAAEAAGADVPDRILRTGAWLGQGVPPGGGDEVDPGITAPRKLDDTVDVIITGPVPGGGR